MVNTKHLILAVLVIATMVICGILFSSEIKMWDRAVLPFLIMIFILLEIYYVLNRTLALVQLEAMRHTKPVINTNLGTGVNYVSIDKETGLTVEPKNVEQLTNAIKELINNDELRLQYGRNARKRVEELFDIEKLEVIFG